MFNEEFYIKLTNRRRGWEVIQPDKNQVIVDGSQATLSKALALSKLEIPVGDWVTQELAKTPGIPESVVNLLELNIADEDKHDRALNNLRAVFPVKAEDDTEVDRIVARANELAEIYSQIVMAGVLESSLFFVVLPIYRFLGGSGFRTIANDISNDETLHVSANVQLAKDLGYHRGKAIDRFRGEIIDWLTSDLNAASDNKYLSADFWQQSSASLYSQGKAENLKDTKRSVMPAFFETSQENLPLYS